METLMARTGSYMNAYLSLLASSARSARPEEVECMARFFAPQITSSCVDGLSGMPVLSNDNIVK